LRRPLTVAAVILVLYSIGSLTGLLTTPKLKAGDLLANLKYKLTSRPENLDKFLIVAIDDQAVRAKWPWKRDVFANLVYKLIKHQPAVIAFDLVFSGTSPVPALKASDDLLAGAFRDAGNVILASYFDSQDGRYIVPAHKFTENALGYGFTNKPEDKDGVIRETRLFRLHALQGEVIDYAFDLKVVWAFAGKPLAEISPESLAEKLNLSVPENGIIPLNYSARLADFTVVPLGEVISGNVSPDLFRGRIVLVGATGEALQEANLTPLGKMASVGIIANTAVMLLNRDFIYHLPAAVNIALLLVLSVIISILTVKRGIYSGTIWTVVILALFAAVSLLLVINNISWDFFSVPLVVLAVYLTGVITNYVSLLIQSFKIKKFVIVDILTGLPTRRYFLLKLDNILKHLREDEELSLVLFGIDNFEQVVSELGAEKANNVIKEAANLIVKSSRKTRGIDFIARYGEIEFCSVLRQVAKQGARSYEERIGKTLNEKITSVSSLALSAGIADSRDVRERYAKPFVKRAEAALLRARKEGANKICVYDREVDRVPLVEYKEEKEISEIDLSYVTEELEEKYKAMAIMINKLRTAQEEVIKSERLSAVGKVAATLHHDLSKPIVNLKSSLEMVKDDLDKVEVEELSLAKKFVTSALEETKRLDSLSESLKDLYRPREKEVVAVAINEVIEEMLNLSSGQLMKKKIKLNKELDSKLPLVLADRGELKQVFLNLIHNAVESMVKGGELTVISLVSKDRENMAEVRIKDTGCGIPPENLGRIFEAFFTSKREDKGAGLGLYASQEIVKKYGGTIQAESIVDKGTTFKVYLPIKDPRS